MSNIYKGTQTDSGNRVTRNGEPISPRLDLRDHSPTGMDWGYFGSGPAQLALAILAAETDDETALQHYQEFKRRVIGSLPLGNWTMTGEDIQAFLTKTRRHDAN